MRKTTNPSALRFQSLLGKDFEVLEFAESTRTAEDAAAAIGCDVAQIAKSLIFRTVETNRSVLVVASGVNRVDEKKIALQLGEKIARADADFVREKTGYSIGGVPPIGHVSPPIVLLDEDLLNFASIWAAAGTSNAVFNLTPAQLLELTQGKFLDTAKR